MGQTFLVIDGDWIELQGQRLPHPPLYIALVMLKKKSLSVTLQFSRHVSRWRQGPSSTFVSPPPFFFFLKILIVTEKTNDKSQLWWRCCCQVCVLRNC